MVPGFDVITPTIGIVLESDGAIHKHLLLISKLRVDGGDLFVESHDGLCGTSKDALKINLTLPSTRSSCAAIVMKSVKLNVIRRSV